MAFALRDWARLLLFPAYPAGTLTTRQASLHAADRVVAPPTRAFDIGLRPGPFPVRAADLLPGLLAVTRTGLAPAGDDEHASRRLRSSRTVLRLQGALPWGLYTDAAIERPPFDDRLLVRVVVDTCLNLREAPSLTATILTCLPNGTVGETDDFQSTWFHIRTDDGLEGWASAEYLRWHSDGVRLEE